MSEIYIPTHLVPQEILNQLKEISQQIQKEGIQVSTSPPSSSPALSSHLEDDSSDEILASITHCRSLVIGEGVTSPQPEVTPQAGQHSSSDNDMPRVLRNEHSKESTDVLNVTVMTDTQAHLDQDSEVVCVLPCLSPSPVKTEESQGERENQTVTQTCERCPSSAHPLCPSASVQTSQQPTPASEHNKLDHFSSSLALSQQSSDFTQLASSGDGAEMYTLNTFSSSTSSAQETAVSHSASPSKYFQKLCVSDPSSNAAGQCVSSSEVRTQLPASTENKAVRIIPPRFATSSVNVGPRSSALLTPPETPKGERKRGVPEVFTFDDIECMQERFRLMVERLQHLQEQHAHHSSTTLTGHPSSLPPTPSLRHLDLPSSVPPTPSYRWLGPSTPSSWGISPSLTQHSRPCHQPSSAPPHLKPQTAEVSRSPSAPNQYAPLKGSLDTHQLKQKAAEVPGSSTTSLQSAASEQFPLQCQESHPPKPHTSLGFEIDGLPYLTASQPFFGSGSEDSLPFPHYPIRQLYTGSGGSGNQNVASCVVADIGSRKAPLADYQIRRGNENDCRDERGRPLFTESSRPCETVEFQKRMALQEKGYTLKKRRFDLHNERSGYVPLCACATMEQNLLQMAESAYRWLRRADSTSADFDRFCTQLAHTNEKLRESMELFKHIRDICDHRK